ncbi:hypothetical protein CLAFUW4_06429 [Fulvia fulva]|uniref:Uncharacterized protein n=1 Tax=Passalora fulva TaxID=5499 RepID=A0A9Q8LJ56_PASFU|nr:uncharacterized protein CLAFUR5_06572 [Fulvia fulva]KAK4623584.1 hypothetical protein CLAFUR4_06432 [Fulvia fulva]KAK4625444.1 hypothetical protein CLAFUR0_06433 [Fulvia fulva]UJO18357.1 hypothetical protein CLAFUR5_06572 [Fulvia fulva]WPV14959.1 hypothetical protein CLAFUW4_06429 [Fulvia fulva]WPV29971.1 hypothetical protein CLAFUW7_06428 [Fulvia fulva]
MIDTGASARRDPRSARLQARNRNKDNATPASLPHPSTTKISSNGNEKIKHGRIIKRQASSSSTRLTPEQRHEQQLSSANTRITAAEEQLAATTRRLLNKIRLKKQVQRTLDDNVKNSLEVIRKLKRTNSGLLSCLALATVASIWDRWGGADGVSHAASSLLVPAVTGVMERVLG